MDIIVDKGCGLDAHKGTVVACIMGTGIRKEVAHTGGPGDGIICILPAEKIFRIRTKSEVRPEEI